MDWGTNWAEAGKPRFELGRFNLQFEDRRAEMLFRRDTLAQSIRFVRGYQFAGILLYAAFGILDYVLGDPARFSVLLIRLGLVTPILVGVFLLTFRSDFYRIMQPALALAMIACGMGVVAMTAVTGPPSNTLYYAGLILIVSYCGNLIRLNFLYSAAISVWLFACYQLVALWLNPIPLPVLVSNDFFLGMATGVGLFAAYIQELYMRQAYIAQKQVEEKNWLVSESLAEAMRANKSRGEFLATMSHELRTPLNAIIGFSDIISRELFGPIRNSKYTEYAHDIHESGAHLLAIINDILDLAKAESGKLELSETEFDAAETLRASMRMCQMRANESGVRVALASVSGEVRIIADERLLLQVFSNLITNAIKFTADGGIVRLQVSAHPEKGVAFKIRDTGIGIAPENIERVLRPFEQVETSYSRSHGGVGLGLPYSKKLTELHGGSLEIESQVGEGTTIIVRLPSWRLVGSSLAAAVAAE